MNTDSFVPTTVHAIQASLMLDNERLTKKQTESLKALLKDKIPDDDVQEYIENFITKGPQKGISRLIDEHDLIQLCVWQGQKMSNKDQLNLIHHAFQLDDTDSKEISEKFRLYNASGHEVMDRLEKKLKETGRMHLREKDLNSLTEEQRKELEEVTEDCFFEQQFEDYQNAKKSGEDFKVVVNSKGHKVMYNAAVRVHGKVLPEEVAEFLNLVKKNCNE